MGIEYYNKFNCTRCRDTGVVDSNGVDRPCPQCEGRKKVSMIDSPPHYTKGKIEVIDFIQDQKLDYCEGNVVKYICRYKYKGTPIEDLKKAKKYIDFKIKELEE